MAINIKDLETEKLARKAADAFGITITEAVRRSLSEFLSKLATRSGEACSAELLRIGQRCASRAVLDPRSPEEIIDYDEGGLPR